ncbi:MAG: ABC transporter ATP-binding protein [Mangrovicoccus sp.]
MSDPVLQLDAVSRIYRKNTPGEIRVLDAAELRLHAGEMVALVAPSGAGKSTLLHIAGLLDRPDTGQVHVAGQATSAMNDRGRTQLRREKLGFVYQFHHLLPEFSALENIALPQQAGGASAAAASARAAELLQLVGLEARAAHRPGTLSGGEQQRVALCRALANRPAVLLADEPTGNLDPDTAERVFATTMDLVRGEGLAALIATHNPDLAARMDRVLRLDKGRLVEG